jgi:hypothetical protein
MASSIFPDDTSAGSVVIRDIDGNCLDVEGVHNAYCPPDTYEMTCELTALPSDCNARFEPRQLNAIVSELVAFAECLDPDGPWDCTSLKNLCHAFTAWYAANKGAISVGPTPPADPPLDSLWWDSDDEILYVWNGTDWVKVSTGNIDKAIIYIADDPPPGVPDNSLWWDSSAGVLYVRYNDGTSVQWVVASPVPDVDAFVHSAGDTMDGPLVLSLPPTDPSHATNKFYVDQAIAAGSNVTRSHLAGYNFTVAGGSNSFTVSAGSAADSTNTAMITTAAAITKTTAGWALGTGNGCLDTGAIAPNTWYHIFSIRNPTSGVTAILASVSLTAPTLPSGFTQFRRIFSLRTDASSQWTAVSHNGDEVLWTTRRVDTNAVATTAAAVLTNVSVPPGLKCNLLATLRLDWVSGGNVATLVTSPDEADQAAAGAIITSIVGAGGAGVPGTTDIVDLNVRTVAQQVRVRSSGTTATTGITARGYIDRRGRDN